MSEIDEYKSSGGSRRAGRASAATSLRKRSTKERLIDAGEHLFGRHGFDGISLREIATAAGQSNNNVVQYHFKNKQGLIRAILEDRVGRIEVLRCERLSNLSPGAESDPRKLLEIIWLPMMSVRSADGSHTFCRFLLQYMLDRGTVEHPIGSAYKSAEQLQPTAQPLACLARANALLRTRFSALDRTLFSRRLTTLSTMFLASVVEYDNARALAKRKAAARFDPEPILDMAVAALSAPGQGRT